MMDLIIQGVFREQYQMALSASFGNMFF